MLACLALSGCQQVDPLEAIRKQQEAGDYQGSVEPLRELLKSRPDDPEVNYLYGRALSFTEPNLAGWSLRKAMEDPAWLVPAGAQLAYLALVGTDYNEAVKIAGRILEKHPDDVRALLMRANAYAHSRKDPERALADAKRVLEIDRDVIEAYEPMILALLGLDRLEEAGEALAEAGRRAVDLGSSEGVAAWHCATTAIFEQESGDLEKAGKTWIACLEAHPKDVDVVTSAVRFYDSQGEQDRSLEVLRAALAGDPDSRILRLALAQRLQASGDAAEGEALLREATRSDKPGQAAAAWMDLAKYRQGLGDFAAAADAMERALALGREAGSEQSPQELFEYADALVLAERYDRALGIAEDLEVPAHRHLIQGRVAQERRDPVRALQEFDEALRLWPDNPWARYYAAAAAEELGDFDRAIEEYRNAVRIAPGATDARTRGASLLLASGRPGAALVILQTAMEEAPLDLEAQLLGMRISGQMGNTTGVAEYLAMIEKGHPTFVGRALAEAADGLAMGLGPALAVSMLMTAPGVDFGDPRYWPALRALVRHSRQVGKPVATQAAFQKILATHPDSSEIQEIRAFDLELSGAPAQDVSAAYARALELGPGNAQALAGLGRLAVGDDPAAALGYFDRAAAANPSDPALKLAAARALIASGKLAEAEQRLDAILVEYPFQAEPAAERAQLDLARGIATPQTIERAHRAVAFGGGADALDLLSKVHAQRNEPELAERAAEQARALREAKPSEG